MHMISAEEENLVVVSCIFSYVPPQENETLMELTYASYESNNSPSA